MVEAVAPLRARHSAARWTRPDQLHLTMAFLGAMAPDEVPRLEQAIAGVTARWAPFAVTMGDGGGFTQREDGGVAWLTVGEGAERVAALSLELDEAMATRAFERRPPRPHLTLARKVTDDLLADVRDLAPHLDLGWQVDNVALFRSYTDRHGSRYEELARYPLAANTLTRPMADA